LAFGQISIIFHDVELYVLQATGLYSYKIYGELKGIEPEICAKVYMDLDYRKIWDGYVKGEFFIF